MSEADDSGDPVRVFFSIARLPLRARAYLDVSVSCVRDDRSAVRGKPARDCLFRVRDRVSCPARPFRPETRRFMRRDKKVNALTTLENVYLVRKYMFRELYLHFDDKSYGGFGVYRLSTIELRTSGSRDNEIPLEFNLI